jgi:hypothetical protein
MSKSWVDVNQVGGGLERCSRARSRPGRRCRARSRLGQSWAGAALSGSGSGRDSTAGPLGRADGLLKEQERRAWAKGDWVGRLTTRQRNRSAMRSGEARSGSARADLCGAWSDRGRRGPI